MSARIGFPRLGKCTICNAQIMQKGKNHLFCCTCADARCAERRKQCTQAWRIRNGLRMRPGAGRGWNFRRRSPDSNSHGV